MTDARPRNCPTCDSPQPHLHPAIQFEGEVHPCKDPWHHLQPDARREPVLQGWIRRDALRHANDEKASLLMLEVEVVDATSYRALADRLAECEAQVKELEHEANQEGQQFRQFAQDILPPGMCVATEGAISFGKLKEVVEAAIAIPTRELAKLEQQLAEVERNEEATNASFYRIIDNLHSELTDAQATIRRYEVTNAALPEGELAAWRAFTDRQRARLFSAEQQVARLRECLERIYADTVLTRQSADYYGRIMGIWMNWIAEALRETGAA